MISLLKKIIGKLKLNTVRKKLLFLMLTIVVIVCSFSIYSFLYTRSIVNQYNDILKNLYLFNNVIVRFNLINDVVDRSRSKPLDLSMKSEIKDKMDSLIKDAKHIEKLSENTKISSKVSGMRGMIETYSERVEAVFTALKLQQNLSDELDNCRLVAKFLNDRIIEIEHNLLDESSILYSEIEENYRTNQVYLTVAFSIVIALSVFIILYLSSGISKSITRLARTAEKIASGDLDVKAVKADTNDEISVLANSFNKMSSNIRILVNEIMEKANIESKLKEEEMKNLRIATLLREAELSALQAQINPHFLFNTLNTIARMALLENADTTMRLIESTSELLRYNLGKIKQEYVTLRDEIDNVREYVYIQKIRFSDRIEFDFEIDDTLLDVKVPYLFLQPLVENAIIHGVEPKEGPGKLAMKVFKSDASIIILVIDNGVGIDEEKLANIFIQSDNNKRIGILNVSKRLEYFFGYPDMLEVTSQVGEGTAVTVKIPYGA